jgi:hypothetical protein
MYPDTVMVQGRARVLRRPLRNVLEGPLPPVNFDNDGCTASPDYLPPMVELWPACWVHDWHYSGRPGVSRAEADAIFRRNLYALMRAQGVSWVKAAAVATVYWTAVRLKGAPHYRKGD